MLVRALPLMALVLVGCRDDFKTGDDGSSASDSGSSASDGGAGSDGSDDSATDASTDSGSSASGSSSTSGPSDSGSGASTTSQSGGTTGSVGTTPTGGTTVTTGTTDATSSPTTTGSGATTTAGTTTGSAGTSTTMTSVGTTTGGTTTPVGWQARRRLDFVPSILSDGLTGFPVLVLLNTARVEYGIMKSDGTDLRFYDRNDAPLPHEIESWNAGGTSVVWVRVNEIDANDNHFFMEYGNLAAPDTQDAPAVWTGAYEAVWHMADNPTGLSLTDSTGNGHTGTLSSTDIASVAGRVGPAMVFDGDDSITVPDTAGINLTTAVSLEGWVNPVSVMQSASNIVNRSFYYSLQARFFFNNPGGMGVRTGGLTSSAGLLADLPTTTWSYLSGTWAQNVAIRLFLNGGFVSESNVSTNAIPANSTDITIGGAIEGTIDEVRIAAIRHSDAWQSAQYESMTDQLLTYGAPAPPP